MSPWYQDPQIKKELKFLLIGSLIAAMAGVALALLTPAAPPAPQPARLTPADLGQLVHVFDDMGADLDRSGYGYNRYTYMPRLHAWCTNLSNGTTGWGGCVPEYTIPPEELKQLRKAAGLDANAPVFKP